MQLTSEQIESLAKWISETLPEGHEYKPYSMILDIEEEFRRASIPEYAGMAIAESLMRDALVAKGRFLLIERNKAGWTVAGRDEDGKVEFNTGPTPFAALCAACLAVMGGAS